MCGILGSINMPFDVTLLDRIKHRGPDDFGIEEYIIDGNVVNFGHRRLSIVDVSDSGHQPMTSKCKNYSLIFNGEIYNHLELKRTLPEDVDFIGHSDTETILYYLQEFGIEAIKDLNGIFGLAYLDIPNKLLHLARDRYGVKPLYYYSKDDKLIFASELRPITYVINPEIDLGAIGNCLGMRYFLAPLTPFKGISKLEPGQLITINLKAQKFSIGKDYFLKRPPIIGSRNSEQSGLVQIYGSLFEKAVERQLMADVDIGILLSGGIDSALVAAVAKVKSKRKLQAFTVGYTNNHSEIDETIYARETAELLGIELFTKECGFEDFLMSIKKIVEIVEEPIGTTSIMPMYFLAELASSKVKVVLSGQGADEPLGGYFKYKALPSLNIIRKFKYLKNLFSRIEPYCQKNENVRRLFAAISPEDHIKSYMNFIAISSSDEIYKVINSSYSERFKTETCKRQQEYLQILEDRAPGSSDLKDLFPYYDLRTSLPDDLLMYTDKLTMHFGLECRVPILDNELIEFIESLHSSKKYNFLSGKIIHKLFAKEYLPSSIIDRKKVGFNSPSNAWFRENQEQIHSILNSNIYFKKLFAIDKVNKLITEHADGANLEKQIFLLLAIGYFLEDMNEKEISKSSLIAI